MNSPDPAAAASDAAAVRRTRLIRFGAALLVVAFCYGVYWLLYARHFESTDDAYVAADMVSITSEVPGQVIKVLVDDTQHVDRGQLLVQLDPADAELALARAEAELARTVRQVRSLYEQADGLRAQIREREVALKAARADFARREALQGDGAVSGEELAHARDQVAQLEAGLNVARSSLDAIRVQIDGTTVENHPLVSAASTQVREAALALKRTRIVAPIGGTIARRGVQIGERIAAGAPLMALVPLEDVWVDANFREVQLEHLHVGQTVKLSSDLYGSDVVYNGRVVGLGAGSGSAFALLPPQNASGNWIKVVQRVPVRIALESDELKRNPLRVGLSMHATVDMRDRSDSQANDARTAPVRQLAADDEHAAAISESIAEIIARNAGASLLRHSKP